MSDLKYWIAFDKVRQMGTVRFRLLEGFFGSLKDAWYVPSQHLRTAGLDRRTVGFVEEGRKSIDPDAELERLHQAGVSAFSWNDSGYPSLLKQIPDPPPVLYVKGRILPEDQRSIALVGTRRATNYGREAAQSLAAELAQSGITVVSGLARGIDTVAHHAVLNVNGRTLAVMASGVDYIYPRENRKLSEQIAETGALISEHPLGVRPDPRQFPRRNRLMSGMTLGTLVVEAGPGSGAIWTVRHALEQDRDVFCVPGSIFSPGSSGPNQLIQEGAKRVTNYRDILQEMNVNTIYNAPIRTRQSSPVRREEQPAMATPNQMPLNPTTPELVGDEKALLAQISYEPIHIDQISRGAGLPAHVVSSTLTIMELNGLVKQVPGMQYVLAREATGIYG